MLECFGQLRANSKAPRQWETQTHRSYQNCVNIAQYSNALMGPPYEHYIALIELRIVNGGGNAMGMRYRTFRRTSRYLNE